MRGTGFNGKEVELLLSPVQLLSSQHVVRDAAEITLRMLGAPGDSRWLSLATVLSFSIIYGNRGYCWRNRRQGQMVLNLLI